MENIKCNDCGELYNPEFPHFCLDNNKNSKMKEKSNKFLGVIIPIIIVFVLVSIIGWFLGWFAGHPMLVLAIVVILSIFGFAYERGYMRAESDNKK